MIEVESLSKLYGEFRAVQSLSFGVAAGEVVGLVGPNGAGKTTTLRSIAGIVRPSDGRVRVAGHDIEREPVAAKSALAFIPDEPHLFDYLTVEEHLRFVGRLYGVADARRANPGPPARSWSWARSACVLPGELSRGMRQKLAIACGLLHDPRALLLDEPLTGLDPVGIRRMKATIVRRAEAGAAVLLSSHLLHLVEEVCDRVLVLHHGRAVAFGTIAEIVAERPALAGQPLEAVFLALVGYRSRRRDGGTGLSHRALRAQPSRAPRGAAPPAALPHRVRARAGVRLGRAERRPAAAAARSRSRRPRGRAARRRDAGGGGGVELDVRERAPRTGLLAGRGHVPLPGTAHAHGAHPLQAGAAPAPHPAQRRDLDAAPQPANRRRRLAPRRGAVGAALHHRSASDRRRAGAAERGGARRRRRATADRVAHPARSRRRRRAQRARRRVARARHAGKRGRHRPRGCGGGARRGAARECPASALPTRDGAAGGGRRAHLGRRDRACAPAARPALPLGASLGRRVRGSGGGVVAGARPARA